MGELVKLNDDYLTTEVEYATSVSKKGICMLVHERQVAKRQLETVSKKNKELEVENSILGGALLELAGGVCKVAMKALFSSSKKATGLDIDEDEFERSSSFAKKMNDWEKVYKGGNQIEGKNEEVF